MTTNAVLQDLFYSLESGDDGIISYQLMQAWPEDSLAIFLKLGLLKQIQHARTTECPGCEQNCFMPVNVMPEVDGRSARAYVACVKRGDMGFVAIQSEHLKQYQITGTQIAKWLCKTLGLNGTQHKNKATGGVQLGTIQGKKRIVELHIQKPLSLIVPGHSLSLAEVIHFDGTEMTLDHKAIMALADLPADKTVQKANNTKSNGIKKTTQNKYKQWQKAFLDLKQKHPTKSDTWYSQQIAKSPAGSGHEPEYIRKNMK